jgi:hypothetical protein
MKAEHSANEPLAELPHLADIFQALRRGRHIDIDDGALYTALKARTELFTALFAQLGFELKHHGRDFYYFLDRDNFTELSERMAVFVFVLIEHLADRGEPIEDTLMTRVFRLGELPHLVGDRPRQLMAEAGVTTPADIEQTVRVMERLGFVRRVDSDGLTFRTAAYRFLDLCLEMAAEAPPSAPDSSDDEEAA